MSEHEELRLAKCGAVIATSGDAGFPGALAIYSLISPSAGAA